MNTTRTTLKIKKLDGEKGWKVICEDEDEYEIVETLLLALYEWSNRDRQRSALASWKPLFDQVVMDC